MKKSLQRIKCGLKEGMSNTNTPTLLQQLKQISGGKHTFSKRDGYTTIKNRETKEVAYFGCLTSTGETLTAMLAVSK